MKGGTNGWRSGLKGSSKVRADVKIGACLKANSCTKNKKEAAAVFTS